MFLDSSILIYATGLQICYKVLRVLLPVLMTFYLF